MMESGTAGSMDSSGGGNQVPLNPTSVKACDATTGGNNYNVPSTAKEREMPPDRTHQVVLASTLPVSSNVNDTEGTSMSDGDVSILTEPLSTLFKGTVVIEERGDDADAINHSEMDSFTSGSGGADQGEPSEYPLVDELEFSG